MSAPLPCGRPGCDGCQGDPTGNDCDALRWPYAAAPPVAKLEAWKRTPDAAPLRKPRAA